MASEKHKPEGYIHDYEQFLSLSKFGAFETEEGKSETVKVRFLDIKAINKPLEIQLKAAFTRVLESGCFVLGPEVDAFEKEWAAYCNADHCVGVGSGLAALQLLLVAAGVKPYHEVIVPSNTYIATVLAISHAGAKPVFVEPDPLTHTLDVDGLASAITENTHSIMTVDLYGQTCDMDPILAIAKSHGLYFLLIPHKGMGPSTKDA